MGIKEKKGAPGGRKNIFISPMPRPEYKKDGFTTIYAEVPKEIKDFLSDICYHLDKDQRQVLEEIIREYHARNKVKPRPRRAKG